MFDFSISAFVLHWTAKRIICYVEATLKLSERKNHNNEYDCCAREGSSRQYIDACGTRWCHFTVAIAKGISHRMCHRYAYGDFNTLTKLHTNIKSAQSSINRCMSYVRYAFNAKHVHLSKHRLFNCWWSWFAGHARFM